ncbi:MAG: ABC transporter permease [Thermoprotei archaeon]
MGTLRYLALRVVERLGVLVAVAVINFFIFAILPAIAHINVASLYLPKSAQGLNSHDYALALQNLDRTFGLDQPLYIRFLKYMVAMFTFHFGLDYTGSPVISEIEADFWNTFAVVIPALILSTILAVNWGIYAASKRGNKLDHTSSVVFQFTYNIPSFWVAVVLLVVFAGILHWSPISMTTALLKANGNLYTGLSYYERFAWAATLPIVTLTLLSFGARALLMRNNSVEVLDSDFVKQARIRGVRDKLIYSRHVMRNALLPVVTRVGIDVAFLLSGVVFIEYAFNFNGLGSLLVKAAVNYDIPLLEGDFFIISFMAIMVFLAMDLIYPLIDPRVRY